MVQTKELNGSGLPLEVTKVIDCYPAFNIPQTLKILFLWSPNDFPLLFPKFVKLDRSLVIDL